jgi:hypothetical protein
MSVGTQIAGYRVDERVGRGGMGVVYRAMIWRSSGRWRSGCSRLAKVELDAPNGRIRLDENHQAVGPTYLNRLGVKGAVDLRTVRTIPNVGETFGGYFRRNGPLPSRTYPPCVKRRHPPWARR